MRTIDVVNVVISRLYTAYLIRIVYTFQGKEQRPQYLQDYNEMTGAKLLTGAKSDAKRFVFRRDAEKFMKLAYGNEATYTVLNKK